MWGQRGGLCEYTVTGRFTPTHVGTARCVSVSDSGVAGSPPRMWGQPSAPCRQPPGQQVHPHACGDSFNFPDFGVAIVGSPPRMWGQLLSFARLGRKSRFTPTHVGTAVGAVDLIDCVTVHPHACGDSGIKLIGIPRYSGSPPRMWGQPFKKDNSS